jgi:hypothetical protein
MQRVVRERIAGRQPGRPLMLTGELHELAFQVLTTPGRRTGKSGRRTRLGHRAAARPADGSARPADHDHTLHSISVTPPAPTRQG